MFRDEKINCLRELIGHDDLIGGPIDTIPSRDAANDGRHVVLNENEKVISTGDVDYNEETSRSLKIACIW